MLKIISPDTVVALMPSPWCEKETLGTFLKSLSHIVKAVGTSSVSTGATKVLHIFHLRKSSIVPCWANPLLSH